MITDTFHVKKKYYCKSMKNVGGNEQFLISNKAMTNDLFLSIVNHLRIPNNQGGTYNIFNEFNPSLPIFWNPEKNCYEVKQNFKKHPVTGISWVGANFIAFLVDGRLPTEAEWEICATAGNLKYQYPWGNSPPSPQLANYGEYIGSTSSVASYPPNEWGLYDMAGNIEEWCLDWYYPSCISPVKLQLQSSYIQFEKVVKGGSWNKGEELLACQSRRGKFYRIGTVGIGFRILWDLPQAS